MKKENPRDFDLWICEKGWWKEFKNPRIVLFVRVSDRQDDLVYSKTFEYLVRMLNICCKSADQLLKATFFIWALFSIFMFFLTFSAGIKSEYWAKMGQYFLLPPVFQKIMLKFKLNFYFHSSLWCLKSKIFIRPFDEPQESVKIKI